MTYINNVHTNYLPEGSYTTPTEYAKDMKISRQAVLKQIKEKKLTAFRIGNQLLILVLEGASALDARGGKEDKDYQF